jgi:glyoxylase-like metal-dependent hydrolase (beta-lactamase superfamily II)
MGESEAVRVGPPVALLAALVLAGVPAQAPAESWCDAEPGTSANGDDWFRVQTVAPGVFAIGEPRQYEGVTSFLVVGAENAVLFDTGLGVARIGEVVGKLTALPVTVINSHTHFDHVGGNREFAEVRNLDDPFSRASARGNVSESLREYAEETLAEDRVCGALPAGVASRDYELPTWTVSAQVRDGEVLDLGDRRLEVVRTPGHTPDSLCLLDRANGLLFTGDTYYSGEIYLWSPETDVAGYTASIGRLARLVPDLHKLLPAHGPPVAEPRRLLELQQALQDIEAGKAQFDVTDGAQRRYEFGHFSILMQGPG